MRISIAVTLVTCVAFMLASSACRHWFVLPVSACGVMIGSDAVEWLRGRRPLIDPIGLIGSFGYFFFFVAPLLHASTGVWMRGVIPPPDWLPWLGWFGLINLSGLVVYFWVRWRLDQRALTRGKVRRGGAKETRWTIRRDLFVRLAVIVIGISAVLQVGIYASQGGIGGYIHTYAEGPGAFQGLGWLFVISESLPITTLLLYVVLAQESEKARTTAVLIAVVAGFLVLKMLFGGLRGSRGTILFEMLWAIGLIHLLLRPIGHRVLMACGVAALGFAFVYGFYKERDVVQSGDLGVAQARRGNFERLLLGDFGRSDVQAFLLYRVTSYPDDYEYALGSTYLRDILSLVPQTIWPDRPLSVIKDGTRAQHGTMLAPGDTYSTRQYGLAGEALLNFGPWLVWIGFAALAAYAWWVARQPWGRQGSRDARVLFYPFLVILAPIVLLSDGDNLAVFTLQHAMIPGALVFVSSARTARAR